jgi:hypothetical protein
LIAVKDLLESEQDLAYFANIMNVVEKYKLVLVLELDVDLV